MLSYQVKCEIEELAINVNMEINADISFGLESQVTELIETINDGVKNKKGVKYWFNILIGAITELETWVGLGLALPHFIWGSKGSVAFSSNK